jgi:putative membrane protein
LAAVPDIVQHHEIGADHSKALFKHHVNDVPMTAICRPIEIELPQMLGEAEVPARVLPVNATLL